VSRDAAAIKGCDDEVEEMDGYGEIGYKFGASDEGDYCDGATERS
jgi:hypothetical protein